MTPPSSSPRAAAGLTEHWERPRRRAAQTAIDRAFHSGGWDGGNTLPDDRIRGTSDASQSSTNTAMPQPALPPEWEIPKLRTSFSFEVRYP